MRLTRLPQMIHRRCVPDKPSSIAGIVAGVSVVAGILYAIFGELPSLMLAELTLGQSPV